MRRIIDSLFCSHNAKLLSRLKNVDVAGCNVGGKGALLPTQQFGASLEWIREHQVPCSCNLGPELGNNVLIAPRFQPASYNGIPPIMLKCIDFLSRPDCLETEGIFRRPANAVLIKELQVCNMGIYLSCAVFIIFLDKFHMS